MSPYREDLCREFGRRFAEIRDMKAGTPFEEVLEALVELADWAEVHGLIPP